MGYFKKTILPILLAGVWINISETIRWEFLIKSHWIEHHQKLGIAFPEEPINIIVWMIWGFLLAAIIFILSKKFNLLQTAFFSWFVVFIMLWIVMWNLDVLPNGILLIAGPLSLLEAFVAALICKKLA